MANTLFDVKNVHVSINETDGEVTFLHKVMDGAVDKSYGINVAKLANLPDKVISRANELLEMFESKEKGSSKPKVTQYQLNLDSPQEEKEDKLRDYLGTIDPLYVTPIEAINILDKLKKLSKEE
jgi:DNA mismatch repair protein MutS